MTDTERANLTGPASRAQIKYLSDLYTELNMYVPSDLDQMSKGECAATISHFLKRIDEKKRAQAAELAEANLRAQMEVQARQAVIALPPPQSPPSQSPSPESVDLAKIKADVSLDWIIRLKSLLDLDPKDRKVMDAIRVLNQLIQRVKDRNNIT